eukprot:4992777-Prymnesium_polylepis.1
MGVWSRAGGEPPERGMRVSRCGVPLPPGIPLLARTPRTHRIHTRPCLPAAARPSFLPSFPPSLTFSLARTRRVAATLTAAAVLTMEILRDRPQRRAAAADASRHPSPIPVAAVRRAVKSPVMA